MRIAPIAAALMTLLIGAPAQAQELTPNPEAPPIDERTPAELEQERLARYKFEPMSAYAGRNVRRVTFQDLFVSPFAPGIVFERQADGTVKMEVVSAYGKRVDSAVLKPEAWAYITGKDAFSLKTPRVRTTVDKEICHGSSLVVEAVEARKTARYDAAMCNGAEDTPAFLYARRLAQVAIDSIPRCSLFREFAREPSWTLTECLKRTTPGTGGRDGETVYASATNPPGETTNFAISTSTASFGAPEPVAMRERYQTAP
jgi:hypothetical protein